MKKISTLVSLLFIFFCFCSCSSDEDFEEGMNTNGKGSYRVINEASDYADFWEEHFGGYDYESLGINGTMYDVVAHEYDAAGGLVTEKPLGDIKNEGGESKSVVANKLSAKELRFRLS